MRSDEEDPGMGSVEFSGCVVPAGKEFSLESVAWWPGDRNRRVFWSMPEGHLDLYQEHAAHRDDSPVEAKRVAVEIAGKSREWLDEVFGNKE